MLTIKLEKTTLAVLQVYAPNEQSEYPIFLVEVEAAIKQAAKAGHFILMGDSKTHVCTDAETWRGMIGRKSLCS